MKIFYFVLDNDEHFEYYPEDAMFHDIASIPKNLLLDIVKQYKSAKEYCKWCYYKREDQVRGQPAKLYC